MRRYDRAPLLNRGKQYGTFAAGPLIRAAIETNRLQYKAVVMKEGDRLDIIAGREYGDSRLWWVIAGASSIGWSLQVPPGTLLFVPSNLGEVFNLIG